VPLKKTNPLLAYNWGSVFLFS